MSSSSIKYFPRIGVCVLLSDAHLLGFSKSARAVGAPMSSKSARAVGAPMSSKSAGAVGAPMSSKSAGAVVAPMSSPLKI